MNIFFDTEFTGLVPDTTLISLGMVAETGEKFYAQFTDFRVDLIQGNSWIKENVLNNLLYNGVDGKIDDKGHPFWDCTYEGDTQFIRERLTDWLYAVSGGDEPIQLISDVCHYDMYLLCNQVFGGAFNLPENVNPVCHDLCQLLSDCGSDLEEEHLKKKLETGEIVYRYSMTHADAEDMKYAFDCSRELLCKTLNHGELPSGAKHNALYDAEVIKMIYEGLVM